MGDDEEGEEKDGVEVLEELHLWDGGGERCRRSCGLQ